MLRLLQNQSFARLFSAQIIALLGTGLLTVALSLLAYDLAGDAAGSVLGTAFAIKMIAYVGLAPIATAAVHALPRKAVLIGADMIRAAIALMLPFIAEVWQIYILIFVLQAASATFTPAFQATIPDVLPDEADYTRALSLSRLAYDLENLLSPVIAGLLLMVVSYHWLFLGTVSGFAGSAILVSLAVFPIARAPRGQPDFRDRVVRGVRIYLATPRLRGLLALNVTAAAAGAFVLVNTVVLTRGGYGLDTAALALALGFFGGGSMAAALALPRVLQVVPDRRVMTVAAVALSGLMLALAGWMMLWGLPRWPAFLGLWGLFGLLYSAILTPAGRLLRKSAHAGDRPAVYSAQFALSHACWLVTYPLAGWGGQILGLPQTLGLLGLLGAAGYLAAVRAWPSDMPDVLEHDHPDLPPDHPHLQGASGAAHRHRHAYVIDSEHRVWPTHG